MMETLTVERDGHVAVIRHDSPPRNFMSVRFLDEMRRCFQALERDRSVRVIVFSGARADHYCLHNDTDEIIEMMASVPALPGPLRSMSVQLLRVWVWLLGRWPAAADWILKARSHAALVRNAMVNVLLLFDAIDHSSKITVAAINGPCVGGGLEMSMCFDYRFVVDDDSYLIGLPELLIGMIPGFGGTQRMRRLLGPQKALEILLDGRLLTPRQADKLGLVTDVIAADEFQASMHRRAQRLARRSPPAIAGLKRAVTGSRDRGFYDGLYREIAALMAINAHNDIRQRLRIYADKVDQQLALPEAQQQTLGEMVREVDAELNPAPSID